MKLPVTQALTIHTHQFKMCEANCHNYEEISGYTVITHLDDPQIEVEYAKKLAFTDLSYLQRIGIKRYISDPSLIDLIKHIPDQINTAIHLDNCLLARLGFEEILIINSLNKNTQLIDSILKNNSSANSHVNKAFIVPRQDTHACFAITGSQAPSLFAKICGVDLRLSKVNNLQVVQTNIARISAVIIRNDMRECPCFYVLVDQAYSAYFWNCIIDAMDEFTGNIIGSHSFQLLK